MKFKPYYDYVVIEKWKTTEKVGSLYIPTDNDNIVSSKVVSVGEGHFLQSGEIKKLKTNVGDIVIFNKVAAQFSIKEDNVEYFLIHERDILGRIEE